MSLDKAALAQRFMALDETKQAVFLQKLGEKGIPFERLPIVAGDRPNRIPLAPAQQRLWTIHQLEPDNTAYHLIAEEDATKAAAAFDEGHYMQIEVVGKLAGSDQPELADQFMQFMVSDAAQSVLPTTNWMYPAVTPQGGLPEGFEQLIEPGKALLIPNDDVPALREEALAEWLSALSQ